MTDHRTIYNEEAINYERLVSQEDYQGNILKTIASIKPLQGIDVVELGAGTGRVTRLLAPYVRSIKAFDASEHMLALAAASLKAGGWENWTLEVADNRSLPAADACADLSISGWSVCYLVDWNRENWREDVTKALREMARVLRPGGTIMLIETQGTGFTTPHPPEHLLGYYDFLQEQGFQFTWFRSDYRFTTEQDAVESSTFFFGKEMAEKIEGVILPECTGIWCKLAHQTDGMIRI